MVNTGLKSPHIATYSILSVLLFLAVLLSLGVGALAISMQELWAVFLMDKSQAQAAGLMTQHYVLWDIRMPRMLTALLVGAGLAVCGVSMQGLFRNPLADPGLIGVSSGAALGAVLIIVLGSTLMLPFLEGIAIDVLIAIAAFTGGLLASCLVYLIASMSGYTNTALLLLSGVAINAICGAGIGVLTYMANDNQLRDLTFWSMGSVAKTSWQQVILVIPIVLIAVLMLMRYRLALNSLVMGESITAHIGFNVPQIKRHIIIIASVVVGCCVAISGVIGFVGLVVPHLLRTMKGADHQFLMPASLLLGASLVLIADVFARVLLAPAELPIGLLMSLLGGPFFLFLLIKYQKHMVL